MASKQRGGAVGRVLAATRGRGAGGRRCAVRADLPRSSLAAAAYHRWYRRRAACGV